MNLNAYIIKAQKADLKAYRAIVNNIQDISIGYAYSLTKDFHLAEDIVQETLIEVYQHLPKLRNPERFLSWLRKMIYQRFRGEIKKRKLRVSLVRASRFIEKKTTPDHLVENADLKEKIIQSIKQLPQKESELVILFYIKDYSLKEICDFLSIPLHIIKNRLFVARNKLKSHLKGELKDFLSDSRPSKPSEFATNLFEFLSAVANQDFDKTILLIEKFPHLISQKGQVPYFNHKDFSAIYYAAHYGYKKIVELLLNKGADIHQVDKKTKRSIIHIAKDADMVQFLVSKGAVLDVYAAAYHGFDKELSNLITKNPELLNQKGPYGVAPLHCVLNFSTAKYLLDLGANIEIEDDHSKVTPIWHAVWALGPNSKVINLFIQHGVEVDPYLACALNKKEIVLDALDENPKLIFLKNQFGTTFLNEAVLYNRLSLVKELIKRGAKVNYKCGDGYVPLHVAAKMGHLKMAQLLIDHGANTKIMDNRYKKTPYEWAIDFNQTGLINLLK